MSGLPKNFPQQSVPLGHLQKDGETVNIDLAWFLLIYNLWNNTLNSGSGGGGTPASPFDALDAADLLAATSDIPQAFRQISNLKALLGMPPLVDPTPAAQPVQTVTVGASPYTYTALSNGTLSITGGATSNVSVVRQGVTVATGITSSSSGVVQSLTDEKGSGGTFGFANGVDFTAGTTTSLTLSQAYGSAARLWVAFDGVEQGADSYTLSGTTLTFSAAIPVGTNKVYVKGALAATVSASGGLVPLRRLDKVVITYSSTPTVVFLPY